MVVTFTTALPLLEQPPAVTVTPSVAGEAVLTSKVMDGVPWPPVMMPLPMVQAYVAPAVGGTEATTPVVFAQTPAGAEIVAVGCGFTVTVVGAEVALQLPLETVTVNVPLAETVMACVFAPLLQA